MLMMDDNLSTWLARQLNDRAWSARELARRTGVSQTSISRYIEGSSIPGPKVCRRIAQGLGADYHEIMRLAGHLPPALPTVEGEDEALTILRSLPAITRTIVMQILRSLDNARPARALTETSIQYTVPTLDEEIAALVDIYPDLGSLFDEARANLPEHAVHALVENVKIWIHEKQARAKFADLHNKLSGFLSSIQ